MSGGAKPHTDVSPHGTHQTVALGELLNVLCETTTVVLNSELTDFKDVRSAVNAPAPRGREPSFALAELTVQWGRQRNDGCG